MKMQVFLNEIQMYFFIFWASHSNANVRCFGFEIQIQSKCVFYSNKMEIHFLS